MKQLWNVLPLDVGEKKVDIVLCLVTGMLSLVWVKLSATATLYPPDLASGFSNLDIGRVSCFWKKKKTAIWEPFIRPVMLFFSYKDQRKKSFQYT